MHFNDISIKDEFVNALKLQNITEPTNIQVLSAKHIFAKRDLIACSETGSGKTLSYILPILSQLDLTSRNIQAVILVPTQELASQVCTVINDLFKGADFANKAVFLIGEANLSRQIENLKDKPSVVVATPSRLVQLINIKKIKLHEVKYLVLDEADKLLDKTYINDVSFIRKSMMKRIQVLLYSASITDKTISKANALTFKPIIINTSKNDNTKLPTTIKHYFIISDRRERIEMLRKIAKATNQDKSRTLIFVNTKYDVEEALQKLEYHHYKVAALYGNVDKQTKKNALDGFKSGSINYLLATDLAARGLQINNISTVINVNLPEESNEYLHRAGRCGRNGNDGLCISIITENELPKIKKLQKDLKINIVQRKLYNGKLVAK